MKLKASIAACLALASIASASGITLYEDIQTKQIFTEPGENRQKLGSFIQENNVAELMSKEVKGIPVTSKAKKLEFSGTHYLGFTSANPRVQDGTNNNSQGFEFRRNYVQVKAYLNDKDYLRVTMDATKELASAADSSFNNSKGTYSYTPSSQNSGYADVFIKYAYLWLDSVPFLPNTGAEIGVVHRPWIDYEEHNGWYYKSFNKVALEHKGTATEAGPDLVNSADLGINLKSKFDYFTSEIGIFNGEGYHADKGGANQNDSNGMSYEWRLTGHLLGDGKKVGKYDVTKDQYAHISTYGLASFDHKAETSNFGATDKYDRKYWGIHGVYNHPYGLIAGQYFASNDDYKNDGSKKVDIKGWSINGEIRPVKDWTIIGRYDAHVKDATDNTGKEYTKTEDVKQIIYGVAYKASKNVTYIASGKNIKDKGQTAAATRVDNCAAAETCVDKNVYMLTAEVKW